MSRYPSMGYSGAMYDRSLLAAAPQVTRADRQNGYSVDILEQGRAGPSPTSNYNVRDSTFSNFERGFKPLPAINLNNPEKYSEVPDSPPGPSTPDDDYKYNSYQSGYQNNDRSRRARFIAFCKSKTGIKILIVLAIVLVGILCGIGAGVATAQRQARERQNSSSGNSNLDEVDGLSSSSSSSVVRGSGTVSSSSRTRPGPSPTSAPAQPTTITFGDDPDIINTDADNTSITRTITPGRPQPTDDLEDPIPNPPPSDDDDNDEPTPWYCSISNLIPGCKIPA